MGETMYVITPFDFTQEPVDFGQKEAKEYEQYVSKELAKFIGTIQLGSRFFDIKAVINEEHKNQIDFYDSNNKLLHSKRIETPKNKTELITCLLKAQFTTEFRTDLGEFCWKSEPKDKNSENYYFNLNCGNYSKRIDICRRNGKIWNIQAKIYGQKDFNIKELSVSNTNGEWVDFKLDDVFGPKGNHEDGKVRHLHYDKSMFNKDISANIREQYAYKKEASINSSHTSWDSEEKDRITIWNNKKQFQFEVSNITMIDYINKILSHPRSKEIISYLEEEVEREFPGMIEFIKTNFDVYNNITELNYEKDQAFEGVINGIIIPECDFTTQKNKKNLIRKQ